MKKLILLMVIALGVTSCEYEPVNEITIVNNYNEQAKTTSSADIIAIDFPNIEDDSIISISHKYGRK